MTFKLSWLYNTVAYNELKLRVIWYLDENALLPIANNYMKGTKPIHFQYHIQSINIDNLEIAIEVSLINYYWTQFTYITRNILPFPINSISRLGSHRVFFMSCKNYI